MEAVSNIPPAKITPTPTKYNGDNVWVEEDDDEDDAFELDAVITLPAIVQPIPVAVQKRPAPKHHQPALTSL